jgi:hypothetical protein
MNVKDHDLNKVSVCVFVLSSQDWFPWLRYRRTVAFDFGTIHLHLLFILQCVPRR